MFGNSPDLVTAEEDLPIKPTKQKVGKWKMAGGHWAGRVEYDLNVIRPRKC